MDGQAPAGQQGYHDQQSQQVRHVRHALEQALYEVKRTIVGQDVLVERMLVALLARGHLLVEGVPGLAKTMAVKTLAQAVSRQFPRIPVTPEPGPADIIRTR